MDLIFKALSQANTKTEALAALRTWEEADKGKNTEDFEKAKRRIRTIEPLYLYLPVEFPPEEITKIVEKLRGDYGKQFLVEIKIQPDLIAGCAMAYKGIYKDYSIKNKLINVGADPRVRPREYGGPTCPPA